MKPIPNEIKQYFNYCVYCKLWILKRKWRLHKKGILPDGRLDLDNPEYTRHLKRMRESVNQFCESLNGNTF